MIRTRYPVSWTNQLLVLLPTSLQGVPYSMVWSTLLRSNADCRLVIIILNIVLGKRWAYYTHHSLHKLHTTHSAHTHCRMSADIYGVNHLTSLQIVTINTVHLLPALCVLWSLAKRECVIRGHVRSTVLLVSHVMVGGTSGRSGVSALGRVVWEYSTVTDTATHQCNYTEVLYVCNFFLLLQLKKIFLIFWKSIKNSTRWYV